MTAERAATDRPDVSLVLVTYRSSDVCPAAISSFRAEVVAAGLRGEVVVVDHTEDAEEYARLRTLAPEQMLARPNRGYAAGINAGVEVASGELLVVGNPDIELHPGSLGALLTGLARGYDVVGPQLALGPWRFPPADRQSPGEELRRWCAVQSLAGWRCHLERQVADWRRVWDAKDPVPLTYLTGAIMAFHHQVWRQVGPWDDAYFLYFEETDWLRRVAAHGLRTAFVPHARVEHRWGHAADLLACAPHFLRSRRLFLTRYFGFRGRLAARLVTSKTPLHPRSFPVDLGELPAGQRWWLITPSPVGWPAAGMFAAREELPAALVAIASSRGATQPHVLLALDDAGKSIAGAWHWGGERG